MDNIKFKNMLNEDAQIYKICLFYIELSGCYNRNETISFIHRHIKIVYHIITSLMFIFSGYMFRNEFVKVAEIFNYCGVSIAMLEVVICISYLYKNELKFLQSNYGKTYDYESELVSNFIFSKSRRNEIITSKIVHIFIGGSTIFTVNFLIIWTIQKFILGQKYPLLFEFYFPINLEQNEIFYYLIILWQIVLALDIGISSYIHLLSMLLVCLKIMTEIEILQYTLENIEKIIEEKIENNSDRNVAVELMKDCVKHHQFIIKYFENAKTCIKFQAFYLLLLGIILFITVGFVMLSDNPQAKIKFLITAVGEAVYLFMFCYQGEIIVQKCEDLRFSLYNIEWWKLPTLAQTLLKIMQIRITKNLTYTSTMGTALTLDTYANMINGGYSYLNMLNKLY